MCFRKGREAERAFGPQPTGAKGGSLVSAYDPLSQMMGHDPLGGLGVGR